MKVLFMSPLLIGVKQSKIQIQKLIIDAQSKGNKIVGIGSPGRAATLLNYCNIDIDAMFIYSRTI